MLLKLVQGISLFFNHVTVSKGEVIKAFDLFEFLLVLAALHFFILKDLVGRNERIRLVSLILRLVIQLVAHKFTLNVKQTLLILSLSDLFK